jgi:hypothetical protein
MKGPHPMIDKNTKARAIAELNKACAEAVSDVAGILSDYSHEKATSNQLVGGMLHAEAELTKVLDMIRAAKALNQMNTAS